MSWKEDLYYEVKMIDDFCEIELKYAMISTGASVMQLYSTSSNRKCLMELIATNQSFFRLLFDLNHVSNACLSLEKKFSTSHNMM